jgi:hypothetical protein
MTIYIPTTLIIIVLVIGITVYLNTNHPNNPAWNKVKEVCSFCFVLPFVVFTSPFTLGMWLTDQAGWDQKGWKAGFVAWVFGTCIYIAVIQVLKILFTQ